MEPAVRSPDALGGQCSLQRRGAPHWLFFADVAWLKWAEADRRDSAASARDPGVVVLCWADQLSRRRERLYGTSFLIRELSLHPRQYLKRRTRRCVDITSYIARMAPPLAADPPF